MHAYLQTPLHVNVWRACWYILIMITAIETLIRILLNFPLTLQFYLVFVLWINAKAYMGYSHIYRRSNKSQGCAHVDFHTNQFDVYSRQCVPECEFPFQNVLCSYTIISIIIIRTYLSGLMLYLWDMSTSFIWVLHSSKLVFVTNWYMNLLASMYPISV